MSESKPGVHVVEFEFSPNVWVPHSAKLVDRRHAELKLVLEHEAEPDCKWRISRYTREEAVEKDPPLWLEHWPRFEKVLTRRLEAGAREYGDTTFTRPLGEIVGELEEELLDVVGWAFMAWIRMERARSNDAETEE